MLSNDMKKGQTGMTVDGCRFRIEDNAKGIIRAAFVYGSDVGLFDELGRLYAHDIAWLGDTSRDNAERERIEFTAAQEKQIKNIKSALPW